VSEILRFQTNIAQVIAFKFPDGVAVEGQFGDQYRYSLTDGRIVYFPPIVSAKLNEIEMKPGEPIRVCKAEVKKPGAKKPSIEWQVARYFEPADTAHSDLGPGDPIETQIERQLRESVEQAQTRKSPLPPNVQARPVPVPARPAQQPASPATSQPVAAPQPVSSTPIAVPQYSNGQNGNGHSNGNSRSPVESHLPPIKASYRLGLRQILKIVTEELRAAGEQWSDGAKQDLVSTLFIAAQRDNAVVFKIEGVEQ
jgi:hypothetical protein